MPIPVSPGAEVKVVKKLDPAADAATHTRTHFSTLLALIHLADMGGAIS